MVERNGSQDGWRGHAKTILLAIALVSALGPSAVNVVVALGIVYAPRLARIVRASTLVIPKPAT